MSGGGTKGSGTLRPAQGTASGFRPQSWRQFWESGFETELYRWEGLPIGRRRVILEASAWHRNCAAVVCFLRDLDSEQRYRITVFRDRETESYGPQGLNFSAVLPGTSLTIDIHQNHSGTFRIQAAQLS
jgi:hypothetical protein